MGFLMMASTNGGAGFKSKPASARVGGIRKNMKAFRANEAGFCDAVARGYVWMGGIMDGGMDSSHWVSQQLIGLDIDNKGADGLLVDDPLTPDAAIDRLADVGIFPMCLYHTYTSEELWPRYRIVLELDEPVRDKEVALDAISRLLHLFPDADQSCKDVARLYFGTWGDENVRRLYEAPSYKPTSIEDILALPAPVPDMPKPAVVDRRVKGNGGVKCSSFDIEGIKSNVDLLSIVQADTGESGARRGKYVNFHNCPICGHRDCFVYYPATNSWACFSSSNGTGITGGSVIDYTMAKNGMGYVDALRCLSKELPDVAV